MPMTSDEARSSPSRPRSYWQGVSEEVLGAAASDATVLLCGETGTGKTRLARLIHQLSPRGQGPFVTVHCGAFPSNLIERELFGHARGAFPGADRERAGKFVEAADGSLLLDEVDSLPPDVQAKLLRAVQEREFRPVGSNQVRRVRARLIAASSRELRDEVRAGRFRSDLYDRLKGIALHLPPLRERPRPTIAALVAEFLGESARSSGGPALGIDAVALGLLERYGWPGNVRELRNVIERAVALCEGPVLRPEHLPEPLRDVAGSLGGPASAPRR